MNDSTRWSVLGVLACGIPCILFLVLLFLLAFFWRGHPGLATDFPFDGFWGGHGPILFFPGLMFLGIGGLIVLAGRRYVNAELGWLAGFLFICSVGILFYFSMLAEIDIFYSLIIFAGILSIFHFYQKRQYLRNLIKTI